MTLDALVPVPGALMLSFEARAPIRLLAGGNGMRVAAV
jgi:hypothetical protein